MRADLLVLTVKEELLQARLLRHGKAIWSGETRYAGPSELAEAIAELVAEPSMVRPGKRLVVELERPVVQLRVLADLPPVRPQHLRALVEQQANRYFRKNGVPLVIDADRGRGRARPTVSHAAAVEEPVVVALSVGAQSAGFELQDIRPLESPWNRLSLILPQERERRRRKVSMSLRRLAAGVFAIWVCVAGVALTRHVHQRRAVEQELALIQEPVSALREVRREMQLAHETIGALDRDQRERGWALGKLGAINAALPDSSFLASLVLKSNGNGRLTGYATRASEVLVRLDAREAVVMPQFDGQASREIVAGADKEAFIIVFGPARDKAPTRP